MENSNFQNPYIGRVQSQRMEMRSLSPNGGYYPNSTRARTELRSSRELYHTELPSQVPYHFQSKVSILLYLYAKVWFLNFFLSFLHRIHRHWIPTIIDSMIEFHNQTIQCLRIRIAHFHQN